MKQQEYFGFDSINNLEDILKNKKIKNIFLVTGKTSYETCGAKQKIETILRESDISFTRFSHFSPNPKLEEIQKGYQQFKEKNYNMIIAVGGGSAIDVGKAIKLFNFQQTNKRIPLIAIPTTAGSGSEATHFIVYYIGKEKQSEGKLSITLPDYTIIDAQFIMNLPRKIAAETGMDALSQAIESYWSVNSTNKSKKFSKEAIMLVLGNLEKAVNSPSKESRENMLKAANLAGKAINIAQTTACHSIAYPITSYFGVPHGHAATLTLGEMLKYNSQITDEDCNDKRGVNYVNKTIDEIVNLLGARDVEEGRDKIKGLMSSVGLKTKLSELGVDKEGIKIIIKNGFKPERVKNNPRFLTEEKLRKILESIM